MLWIWAHKPQTLHCYLCELILLGGADLCIWCVPFMTLNLFYQQSPWFCRKKPWVMTSLCLQCPSAASGMPHRAASNTMSHPLNIVSLQCPYIPICPLNLPQRKQRSKCHPEKCTLMVCPRNNNTVALQLICVEKYLFFYCFERL